MTGAVPRQEWCNRDTGEKRLPDTAADGIGGLNASEFCLAVGNPHRPEVREPAGGPFAYSIVWHISQSWRMATPSRVLCSSSWQRKQPSDDVCPLWTL